VNYVQDIGVNLLATGAAFCFGLISRTVMHNLRSRRARRFWGRNAKGDTNVFLGAFARYRDFEPTGMIGVGDARASEELTALLRVLGMRFTMSYSDRVLEGQTQSNLILLGGADANELTAYLMARLHTGFAFVPSPMTLIDTREGQQFTAEWDDQRDDVMRDYGLLLRTRNPFNPERTVVVIAGLYGFATWAGVRLVGDRRFLRRSLGEFACVYKTDLIQGIPQHVSPVYHRRLLHGQEHPDCPSDCPLRSA
jgi:hypothetical protein